MIVPCRNFLTIWQTFNRHDSTGVDVKKNKKKHLDRKRIQSTGPKKYQKRRNKLELDISLATCHRRHNRL
jgi:hypothetical protein